MATSRGSKALIIGISGCSSSGKTTLARLLRDIFPDTFVLHEDDFYKPEKQLPTKAGFLDWDSAGSLDIEAMVSSLTHIRKEGTFPPNLDSKEDRNAIGTCPVPDQAISDLRSRFTSWSQSHPSLPTICLFDGFLLYSTSMEPIQPFLDLKLFLRVSHAKAKARREARSGYVTLEGFWEDPPGYVDRVVWPNYVDEHAFLFEGGDVEGNLRGEVVRERGVECLEGVDVGGEEMLRWAVELLMEKLPGLCN